MSDVSEIKHDPRCAHGRAVALSWVCETCGGRVSAEDVLDEREEVEDVALWLWRLDYPGMLPEDERVAWRESANRPHYLKMARAVLRRERGL